VSFVPGDVVDGRYRLAAVLGRGGTASVWAGVDTRLDRPVAVKLIDAAAVTDSSAVQFLDQEARIVARLAHPNIVAVYDVGIDASAPYLVMELVDGEDLRRRLASGPLAVAETVAIAEQVCAALAAAHAAGVVHGDIKPDNVMLTRTGSVKVCDFGIARLQLFSQAAQTRSSFAVGTSEYMAPEQATGGAVDARTDLYALGCVLYAMLSGGPPFSGDSARVLWQQVHDSPLPIANRPDLPPELGALLTELLAKAPADRPGGAAEVGARLARISSPLVGQVTAQQPAVVVRSPVFARATVVAPTRIMPAVDADVDAPPARTGVRLGPAGIVGVAIGAGLVTALLIYVLSAMQSTQITGATPPSRSAASANTASTTEVPTPATTQVTSVDGVRSAIEAQVLAGQINPDDANDLTDRLNDVARDLSRGRTDQAVGRLNDIRDRLDQLLGDDKTTQAGHDAILNAIDELAASIGSARSGNG
jgi:serine/threonine-protein kinase